MTNLNSGLREAHVELTGREELHLEMEIGSNGEITRARLSGVGGPKLLDMLKDLRPRLKGKLADLQLPTDSSVEALLARELILKIRGDWTYPYCEAELCHCRAVPTAVVDQAIVTGAHTPKKVSALTSASTACGTCRPDVEAIIRYRLGRGE